MPIPKPSETKQPILYYLTQAGKPVKRAAITESMGKHFNLTKNEMEETSLKGTKRLAMSVIAATKEMKAAGLLQSPRHGYLSITAKGSEELGLKAEAGTEGSERRKPGRPPKVKTLTNGRKSERFGGPPKAQPVSTNGRRKPGRPKAQVKVPTNGRRKIGGPPKSQIVQQPVVPAIKPDDKMIQRTTDIVRSYVEKNSVNAQQVPGMIESIYATLSGLGTSNRPMAKRK